MELGEGNFIPLPSVSSFERLTTILRNEKDSISSSSTLKTEYESSKDYETRVEKIEESRRNLLLSCIKVSDEKYPRSSYPESNDTSFVVPISLAVDQIRNYYSSNILNYKEEKVEQFTLSKYDADNQEFKIFWVNESSRCPTNFPEAYPGGKIKVSKRLAESFARTVNEYSVKFDFEINKSLSGFDMKQKLIGPMADSDLVLKVECYKGAEPVIPPIVQNFKKRYGNIQFDEIPNQ